MLERRNGTNICQNFAASENAVAIVATVTFLLLLILSVRIYVTVTDLISTAVALSVKISSRNFQEM